MKTKPTRKLTKSQRELVENNTGLAYSYAFRVQHSQRAKRCDMTGEELAQIGILGLIRAAQKFKPEMGFQFSTYATWWVRQSIQRELRRADVIRVPDYLTTKTSRTYRAAFVLAAQRAQSAWQQAEENWDKVTGESYDPDPFDREPENITYMLECVGKLSPRAQVVIRSRFELDGEERKTLEQLAKRLRMTKERVRQIECESLYTLRLMMGLPSKGVLPWQQKNRQSNSRHGSPSPRPCATHSPSISREPCRPKTRTPSAN